MNKANLLIWLKTQQYIVTKFISTLSVEHSRIKTKKNLKLHTIERYYLFLSFENLSTERFLSSLMCFLNLTCPVLISSGFPKIQRRVLYLIPIVSYNRRLRVPLPFWTELSVCHSRLCGLALAILVHCKCLQTNDR